MTQPVKHSKSRGCLKILARFLVAIVLFIAVLAVGGYIYEHYASARDMERYPPPGRWVEVAQRRMHLYCTGQGSPTVVLEAPANGSALDWGYVQPPLAQWTRVCSYDRAGFGWSALGEPPRTAEREAAELHTLLTTAGEAGPYLLVGASYGGHIVRLFAHAYPAETVGVVLVDARPEQFFSIPAIRQEANSSLVLLQGIAFLGDLGLSRPFLALMPEKMIPAAAVPLYTAYPGSYAIVFQSKLWHASYEEARVLDISDEQVAAMGTLGDIPLVVIRHGKPMFSSLPASQAAEMEQHWRSFQETISKQSSASRIVVAERSGHGVQLEQPAIVVEAVQQLLENP